MSAIKMQKFTSSDFYEYFLLVSNESVMRMITERAIPFDEAKENYKKLLNRNNRYEGFGSYKVLNEAHDFIGLGSLILNENTCEEAELGYMLMPNYWGRGYGSTIAKSLIRRAESAGLKRLTAIIDPQNGPSRIILIKNGFHSEKVCEIDGLPGEILSKEL
ncbi:GNAT family N-acetyltransferase [Pullulanibacillus sp. KACC 23026]|uniref:GNAT family N-acetyltransferase n=1 Tax=Pullulanibacillus sp. KACC 23026 TaxID=3028315 RepID=UPI0023B063C9|nr:GNAT family N-acetyltransferase [Pullulanibacillus sp. KACC 23026]WEG13532.1 GNAT family N-acetyltransferase [Pullulanibacillus sp. KACC 23026]